MSLSSFSRRIPTRETLAVVHAATMIVGLAWLFGGMGPGGDWISAALGAPAILLLAAEARARLRAGDRAGLSRMLRWITPMLLLTALVVVSALNPSHRIGMIDQVEVLRPVGHVGWLPSSAHPFGSLQTLAALGAPYLAGLSLAFCVHSRAALRGLLAALAINAVALSVLGTLQRQSHASGPYFGAVAPANTAWFATFHYYNHWGAFAVLQASAALALVFQSLRRPPARGWVHGPGPLLLGAALLVAATAPLSASRSATVLMIALGAAAALAAIRLAARRSRSRAQSLRRAALVLFVGASALVLVIAQSGDAIAKRYGQSVEQLANIVSGDHGYGRVSLYADTWRMVADRPVFGWGLESYGRVFLGYNSARPDINGIKNVFIDAHSDWLQSLAEIGFAGTALLLAAALLPFCEVFRLARLDPVSGWLLGGCALVAAYASVEFPLACPAVVATWWILFFTAARTLQLTPAREPDSSDATCSP